MKVEVRSEGRQEKRRLYPGSRVNWQGKRMRVTQVNVEHPSLDVDGNPLRVYMPKASVYPRNVARFVERDYRRCLEIRMENVEWRRTDPTIPVRFRSIERNYGEVLRPVVVPSGIVVLITNETHKFELRELFQVLRSASQREDGTIYLHTERKCHK